MSRLLVMLCLALLSACGSSSDESAACDGSCADADTRLRTTDVEQILALAIAESAAQGVAATIAVVDRVGNVLAVYRMAGAASTVRIDGGRGVSSGLDGIDIIPDHLAAISKAITAAYLSSEGNAFSTRTASQIVQEFFNPGERNQPAGPLFGVQFSSLPCSDLNQRLTAQRPSPGPHRAPLGLAADVGGLPLYVRGTPVGGVGIVADGIYGLDLLVSDRDLAVEELIALAATTGYAAPLDRLASRITADGKTLRFADAQIGDLVANPALAPTYASLDESAGELLAVPGYTESASIAPGTAFGTSASGVRLADGLLGAAGGFVLVDGNNNNRFAPKAATDNDLLAEDALQLDEVEALLLEALNLAQRARAQIRRPLGSAMRVSVAVVDTYGSVLGFVRSQDAPVFGADVALQKARTATFYSNAAAAQDLLATPDTQYLASGDSASIADYVAAVRTFFDAPTALSDGAVAFSDRAGGNLSRPYFPDGQTGAMPGPLSRPIDDWSVFSVGIQSDLVNSAILQHVTFVLGGADDTLPGQCSALPANASGHNRLPNGIQIFPGSVPIYRGRTLIGGIGVSGDGVDQDDMIAFLSVHQAGQRLGGFGNAPPDMRADTLQPQGVRLRYVQCPQAPFNDSTEQNVCGGL